MMLQVALAYLVDLVIGDPRQITHPVVIIGKCIDMTEAFLRRRIVSLLGLKGAGVVMTAIIVLGSYTVMWLILKGAAAVNHWVAVGVSIWFISTTIAVKGLSTAAGSIFRELKAGNIGEARRQVGMIVGRDTAGLDEAEITRAAVETVAENIVDGIISPMFYAFIGGAPLAMAYKAVNTLDSMVGYKNEKYRELGWASAKFDDICNYIPARVTGLLIFTALFLMGKPVGRAATAVRRDAPGHPSPNSGIPEAAVAGGLGIRLGGLNYYGGVSSFRAYMGEPEEKLQKMHITETVRIMHLVSAIAVAAGTAVTAAVYLFLDRSGLF